MISYKAITGAILLFAGIAGAAGAAEESMTTQMRAGRDYAVHVCAQCHDVLATQNNLLSTTGAPDFHAVANAKTTTAMGLNVFLRTPHSTMPNLVISGEDRRNVIAYILSMRAQTKRAPS